ncbi:ribonucleoside-triphosphate reductase activating protein (plasmid) [Bacillus thuringiensis]|uniref:4Fe-4S single cluster domain-containing protein n=1 Tax=Bacillus thuringiensis TaxID=1428 RepID=UPI00080F5BB6|nr:4Fe-4S single cluster domain-containing protein [Bacillus thuringiensis]ANV74120.1 ribonucleoside-triphosphate reductase activating protein [Bacillus thuringiensis]ANV74514.1 ribonucleoside-triphosphate reductase activating protein [Bacillus thuringiensis]
MTVLDTIQISRIEKRTKVEGPGLRYAIWVQGCPIQCEGCFNPHTWDMKGGVKIEVDEILVDIKNSLESEPRIEGVTFLGGEPFSQAKELGILANYVKELGLSVVTFSGYEYEVILQSNNPHWHSLLNRTDLLIDGPFIQEQYDLSRPWIGSKNQKYRFLTGVYKHLETSLLRIPNRLEIRLHPDGTISANGMAHSVDLDLLHQLGYVRRETHS